jgi:flagellar motor protein MotB
VVAIGRRHGLLAAAAAFLLVSGGGAAMGKKAGGVRVPALAAQIDKSKVDLKEHRMEIKLSLPAGKVSLKVYSDADALLADEEHDFTGRPAGSLLVLTWRPSSDAPVGRIEGHATDATGQASYDFKLTPWFVPIPHEDVNFPTGSSEIQPADEPKLEAAFGKLVEILAKDRAQGNMHAGITLYIAGHTDTVGSGSSNLKLSHDRARSIAAWFRKRGVKQPIAFEGFGETSLKVSTADNVDEPRNRRVDYVLSDGPPSYSAAFKPSWKRIP